MIFPYIGKRVWLYQETSPGVFTVIGQTVTTADGFYNFDDSNAIIAPFTTYYIAIEDQLNEPGTTNPTEITFPNVGTNDNVDSDATIAGPTFGPIAGKPYIEINSGPFDSQVKRYDFGFYTLCEDLVIELPIRAEACENETITIDATPSGGLPPYSYSWSDGQNTTVPTIDITVNTSMILQVTVTDENGCQSVDDMEILVERCDFDLSLSKIAILI